MFLKRYNTDRNKMTKTIITNNLEETQKAATDLAKQITATTGVNVDVGATVIGLTGDLGSGKTAFTQGFAKAIGIKEKITSPTFVIQKMYKLNPPWRTTHKHLIHIDAYRLDDPKELVNLGWEEIAGDSRNIIIVEWAERIKKILPKNLIKINFEHMEGDKRRIKIEKFL